MTFAEQLRRLALAALAAGAIATGAFSASVTVATFTPAAAQISEDAQIALEQYGIWRPHPRFGVVWVPRGVPPDWRPYQYGHWVYTDEWGWYWVSDDVEADWGWVVFHYGRWVFERGFSWFWVPGDEWAPAWVNWRYGDEYIGWAPLPPEELIETYEVEPAYWLFVPGRFLAAPRLRSFYVPAYRQSVILRTTRIVNRTFPVRGQRLAVNPGVSPAFVARVSGAPIATYRVQPRVFASTQGVSGAVHVRREDLRAARGGRPPGPGGPRGRPGAGPPARVGAISVQRTTTVIQPNAAVTAPQPLGKNEPGRLGTHPPRAAQGIAPSTAPAQQQAPTTTTPTPGVQRQVPAIQQPQAPAVSPPPTPPPAVPSTTAPAAVPPAQGQDRREERREERRERSGPGGPPGGSPPSQPNVVRPIPPQTLPPSPPSPQEQRRAPPPPEQRRAPPPPPPPPPPAPQEQRRAPPPPQPPAAPVVRQPPPLPPPAAEPAPPPQPPKQAPPPQPAKKPPPKPGEKPEEKK